MVSTRYSYAAESLRKDLIGVYTGSIKEQDLLNLLNYLQYLLSPKIAQYRYNLKDLKIGSGQIDLSEISANTLSVFLDKLNTIASDSRLYQLIFDKKEPVSQLIKYIKVTLNNASFKIIDPQIRYYKTIIRPDMYTFDDQEDTLEEFLDNIFQASSNSVDRVQETINAVKEEWDRVYGLTIEKVTNKHSKDKAIQLKLLAYANHVMTGQKDWMSYQELAAYMQIPYQRLYYVWDKKVLQELCLQLKKIGFHGFE